MPVRGAFNGGNTMGAQSKGKCKYCGKEYAKGYMLRHLQSCKVRKEILEKKASSKKCGYFMLAIYGKYDKEYWLIIEVNENAKLSDLDAFLRDIWVECCGHLSSFEIDRVNYDKYVSEDSFWGPPSRNMNYKLKSVLRKDMIFRYEYDFGSTTELVLEVKDYRKGAGKQEFLEILSRNNPPKLMCDLCHEKEADFINTQWYEDGIQFMCKECVAKQEAEGEIDEFLLPVCNSPRMGVCGYEGSSIYPDQFVPDCEDSASEGRD